MASINIIDDLPPEDTAMLQALYSRSPASVEDHLKKVAKAGSGKFMEQYYVGYNHASIGDCGTTTVFIEGVSMPTAKAIQDWPLYSGQEASTRYMDFSEAAYLDPVGSPESRALMERRFWLYDHLKEPVTNYLKSRYPQDTSGVGEAQWERTINAAAFDILRGFLPAGSKTNLSWHTNLRQAEDHLWWLEAHPSKEVREVAAEILEQLREKYPNSFKRKNTARARTRSTWRDYFYPRIALHSSHRSLPTEINVSKCNLYDHHNRGVEVVLEQRPPGAPIPHSLIDLGNITSHFMLDYGSFRDLQRHRNGHVKVPLLNTAHGFHPWYLSSIPEEYLGLVETELEECRVILDKLRLENQHLNEADFQSYVPMGYLVPCEVTQPVPGFIYRLELRSSMTVHPTLREVVHGEVNAFRSAYPKIRIHADMMDSRVTFRRGNQTIQEKSEVQKQEH